jgi:hypothetical protein
MPFSKSFILIPVCITVSKAFLEVNKAGEHPAIFIIAVFINYALQEQIPSVNYLIEFLTTD